MSGRVLIDKQNPEVYAAMRRAVRTVRDAAEAAGIDRALMELLNVRVSQLNGCEICLDIHSRAAITAGVTPQRLALLPAWRESRIYDARERAALEIAEAVTLTAATHLDDEAYAKARSGLTDDETSALIWAAITINAFNRISILSRHPVPERDAQGRTTTGALR
ncbi:MULTISPECIES: carboxymuconolactone decarboxylase family protein [Pseudonocardia]|uniref:Alkyl hydroperoxide reductase AhpD n=2 Tax=Pseudonocardia TaxID=1847 RepID=A0A1Y2MY42_PSEAH|nr:MULTISPECIES: carboxymuconolactone decarboxylase family protein [Pseudonocardia]OSY40103.1 Alkyl hydroperoxide reductase AhpD [Pseudonocardia autotrophica]TDN72951.1 AhpD family alkylhydroperoxidase [Pseudonocardia autotrophica]BBG03671.1 alkyl hydroperoxide reductase AhpD [Pseudonocardia autotrophica]GEC26369.1 alkyl hydroperoxide reductase AhpD [Pseudonocardia saturnea]